MKLVRQMKFIHMGAYCIHMAIAQGYRNRFIMVRVCKENQLRSLQNIKIRIPPGRIGQNCFRIRKDWSEFLQDLAGLVRIPSAVGKISQTSLRYEQDWSEFLMDKAGLVRIPSRVDSMGYSSFKNGQIWSQFLQEFVDLVKFLQERADLVRIPSGVGGIGQKLFRSQNDYQSFFRIRQKWLKFLQWSGQDWSEFLQEQAGLVKIPPGVGLKICYTRALKNQ